MAIWLHPETGFFSRLQAELARRKVHAARCVVVLPYAQLLPMANRLWAQNCPDGFAPRFETTSNWSKTLGGAAAGPADLTFDAGLDTLTAQAMLKRAGLGEQQDALAAMLVESAYQLAPYAAAAGPAHRDTWAKEARIAAQLGMDSEVLAWEVAVARIAVEWAAASAYASDFIFSDALRSQVDCLVLVQGINPDPLVQGLQQAWGSQLAVLPLATPDDGGNGQPTIALHACLDAEDEAQRAAACCIAQVHAGRFPVALVSSDRALTRRVRAMLEVAGVAMRDENGWKLSTSCAAAKLMALLKGCAWHATCDAVLDWLKAAPMWLPNATELEAALRREQVRDWRNAAKAPAIAKSADLQASFQAIDAMRDRFAGQCTLQAWLQNLRGVLQDCAMWDSLQQDEAGLKVIAALHIDDEADGALADTRADAFWFGQRLNLTEFTHWVNQALEGASFQPEYPAQEQVVILPMSQMLGRPFAALVMAGCDEVRLNPHVEPPGVWTAAQRAALRLPPRELLETLVRTAWRYALQTPACDVLWRTSDDSGEALMPSSLVQLLQSGNDVPLSGADPRTLRHVDALPCLPPQPQGDRLPVLRLSASTYGDLRDCPYRFFAMRQLGLNPSDELESDVDKRDFGIWLHAVLTSFHNALLALEQQGDTADAALHSAMLDVAAQATTRDMALPDGEFLPFAAAWPSVRDSYLEWLEKHLAQGARFASGETAQTQSLGKVTLAGRIDRIDTLNDGSVMVLDYKTESLEKSKKRTKNPLEDTQIAFYAALLPFDTLRGGYLNLAERKTQLEEQENLVQARDALLEGIQTDMERIAQGSPLPALGDGPVCDYCRSRGLCRKDFWSPA
jgi:ATP-dependent helicase/nuclease subunit B